MPQMIQVIKQHLPVQIDRRTQQNTTVRTLCNEPCQNAVGLVGFGRCHSFHHQRICVIYVLATKAQRIKWLGHIQRMDQARPTRKLLDWKPMGTRPVGRPRQRWQEDVMEDFIKVKIKKNWKERAKDRRTWLRRRNPTKGCSAKWWWWCASHRVLSKMLFVD